MATHELVPGGGTIEPLIRTIRGHRVILDADAALLYGVSTGRLNEQVKRNLSRFPVDFLFQLTDREAQSLISQNAISKPTGRGGRRTLPYAFTEHGVAMLANVLRSPRAVLVSVEIVRTFVRLRQALGAHAELARRLNELEGRYDTKFRVVFDAIRMLMTDQAKVKARLARPPAGPSRRRIGFKS